MYFTNNVFYGRECTMSVPITIYSTNDVFYERECTMSVPITIYSTNNNVFRQRKYIPTTIIYSINSDDILLPVSAYTINATTCDYLFEVGGLIFFYNKWLVMFIRL